MRNKLFVTEILSDYKQRYILYPFSEFESGIIKYLENIFDEINK